MIPIFTNLFNFRYSEILQLFLTKIFSLLVIFFCLPFIVKNVGLEKMGNFFIILAIFYVLGFLDLGIPNGVIGRLSTMNKDRSKDLELNLVMINASIALLFSSIFFVCILALFINIVEIQSFLNLNYINRSDFKQSVFLSLITLILRFQGILGLRVLAAKGRYKFSQISENGTNAIGYVLGAIITFYDQSLLSLAFSLIFFPNMLLFIQSVFILFENYRIAMPARKANVLPRKLFENINWLFLYLQFTTILMTQIDSLVVGSILPPSEISLLNVSWKLFSIPYLVIVTIYGSVWAHTSKIDVPNLGGQVREVFNLSKKIGYFLMPISLIITIFGPNLINMWTPSIYPSRFFCFTSGIWLLLLCVAYPIAMLLNGVNVKKLLFLASTLNMVINLTMSYTLTKLLGDPSGALLGSIIGQVFGFFLPCYIYFVRGNYLKNLPEFRLK